MKYAVEIGSVATIYIPNFIKRLYKDFIKTDNTVIS
jgi:hypothetical protein